MDDAVRRLDVRDLDARAGGRDGTRVERELHGAVAHERARRALGEHLLAPDRRGQDMRREHRRERRSILQQRLESAELANLERIGAVPKQTTAGERLSQTAIEAAAQYWKVTEMDLPVQGVLFDRLVMQ